MNIYIHKNKQNQKLKCVAKSPHSPLICQWNIKKACKKRILHSTFRHLMLSITSNFLALLPYYSSPMEKVSWTINDHEESVQFMIQLFGILEKVGMRNGWNKYWIYQNLNGLWTKILGASWGKVDLPFTSKYLPLHR